MNNYKGITQEMVKKLFSYHEDGYLIWEERALKTFKTEGAGKVWNQRFKNKRAGTNIPIGYRNIGINLNGKIIIFYEHRLIFLYHKGYLPEQIDHIDRKRNNNKINNLRESDRCKNYANSGLNLNPPFNGRYPLL